MWPKLLDLSRDECKRILRRLELEAYASLISAFRAQGDLSKDKKKLLDEIAKVLSISTERHRAEVRRAVNDESLSTVADVLSGPSSTYEWSVEGRRLVPLMPRLVPQTAFTGLANTAANIAAAHNSTLPDPADTAKKEVPGPSGLSAGTMKSPRSASPPSGVVVLPSGATITVKGEREEEMETEPKGRRRKRTGSSSAPHPAAGVSSRTVEARPLLLPTSSNIRVSQGSGAPHSMSPVKITLAKTPPPKSSMAPTATQKIIIVSSQSSGPSFMPNILRSSHPPVTTTTLARILPGNVSSSASSPVARIPSILLPHTPASSSGTAPGSLLAGVGNPVSSAISSTASVVGTSTTAFLSSTLAGTKPRVKTITKQAAQTRVVTTQLPVSQLPTGHQPRTMSPGNKPTIQIKQEPGTGVKIITQTLPGSKILPKPVTAATSSGPQVVMVTTTSSMATRPIGSVTTSTVYAQNNGNRAIVNPAIGTRVVTMPTSTVSAGKTTPPPPTNIITVTPKTVQTMPLTVTRTLPSGATPYTIAKAGPSSAGKPSVIVVQQAKTIKTQQGKPITVVTTYITQSSPRPTFVSTMAGQSLGKSMTLTKAQPQQIKTRVVIRPRTPDQGSLSLSQQQSILGGIVEGIVIQRPASSSPRGSHDSPGTADDTSSVSSAGSEDVVKVQRAGQSPGASQSAPSSRVTTTNQWVEMDAALDIGSSQSQGCVGMSSSQSQGVQGEGFSSAASTIKALLEIQSGAKAQDKPRQSTIDLSQMAVPISVQQQGPQAVAASLQGEVAPEFFATEVVQQEPAAATEAVPRAAHPPPGRQGIRMSSAQHLLAEAHRKIQEGQVLGREEASLLEESYEGFTLDPQTGLFYKDEHNQGGEGKMLHDIKVQTTNASGEPRTYTLTEWFTGLTGDRSSDNQHGQPSAADSATAMEPEVVAVPTEKILESALSASFTSTELEFLRSGGGRMDSSTEGSGFTSVRTPSNLESLISQSLPQSDVVSGSHDGSVQSQSVVPIVTSSQDTGKEMFDRPGTESTLARYSGSERKSESRDHGNIFENIVASVHADSSSLQQRGQGSASKAEFTTLRDYVQSTMGAAARRVEVGVEPVLATQVQTDVAVPTPQPLGAPDSFSQDNIQDLLELLGQATSTLASFDQPSSSKTTVMVERSGFDPSSLKMEDFTSQRVEAESFTKDDPEDRDKDSPDSTIVTPTSVSPPQDRMVSPARMHHPSGSSSGNESYQGNLLDTPMRASKRKRKAPPPLDEDPPPASLPSWARAALGLLHRVSKFRGSGRLKGEMGAAEWFIHPVDPAVAPDYYNIIKHPMDFSTIKKKLEGGQYNSMEEFHADMLLIRSNCFTYNPPGHEARRDCEEVFNFYHMEYGKVVDKCKPLLVVPKSPKKFKLDVSKSPGKSL